MESRGRQIDALRTDMLTPDNPVLRHALLRVRAFLLSLLLMAVAAPSNAEAELDRSEIIANARTAYAKSIGRVWYHVQTQNGRYLYVKFAESGNSISRVPGSKQEFISHYLNEFCSQTFITSHPKIYSAIVSTLTNIPNNVVEQITRRDLPLMFTEYNSEGKASLANSSVVRVFPEDPPTFQKGFRLIKLSTALERLGTPEAIAAVIAHEISHIWLEHHSAIRHTDFEEREANHLIQAWGFADNLEDARRSFGHLEGFSWLSNMNRVE